MDYTDILYDPRRTTDRITINRPEKHNAMRSSAPISIRRLSSWS